MTEKERKIREQLEAQGVTVGSWAQQEAKEARPRFSGNMLVLLEQLREVVQKQLTGDVERLEQLREAANRMKYGGGR